MIRPLQHISLLCCACLALHLGSCTSDRLPDGKTYTASEVGGDVNLSLNVSIGSTSGIGQTRDGEETGTDNKFSFEPTDISYELIKTLRVIIVRPDYTVEFNRLIELKNDAVSRIDGDVLHANELSEDDLKFLVSTDQGYVDNKAMTCTERKRIYLIANEATLDNLKTSITGDGQKFTDYLKGLTPAYSPSKEEEKDGAVGKLGDKLDPYTVERWIIYNDWDQSGDPGTNVNDLLALPIINNEVPDDEKSYIPMTEFFDIDVVSSWHPTETELDNNYDDSQPLLPSEQKADLFVTRNFVKFQFSASSETESFEIKNIRFENVMQKEYLFPFATVYDPVKSINDLADREIVSFKTPGKAGNLVRPYVFNLDKELAFILSEPVEPLDQEMNVPTPVTYLPDLYFCETHNYEANTYNLSNYKVGIDVLYHTANGTKTELVSYESVELENLPYSLPRNTIVRVHMTIKDRKLNAVATVFPYTAVSLNPEFGFSAPETDKLTVAPTMELDMNDPEHREGLLYATYTSKAGTKIDNLIWVSSDPTVILLGPKENDPDPESQLYVRPADSIELPYNQETKEEPVRVIPQKAGTADVKVYSQTGLVASCKVTVK